MGGRPGAWGAAAVASVVVASVVAIAVIAPAGLAFAQTPTTWPTPPEVMAGDERPARELAARPKLSLAVGMGSTFDSTGFSDGSHVIPAFFATGGFGDGLVGVDFGVFASSASGRFRTGNPVDRLALDGSAVIRPAASARPEDRRYRMRVLRTLATEFGLGIERDSRTIVAASRFLVHLGARVDFPLSPAGDPSQLRLRLAASRNLGLYTPRIYGATVTDVTEVGDTAGELYAALVVLF